MQETNEKQKEMGKKKKGQKKKQAEPVHIGYLGHKSIHINQPPEIRVHWLRRKSRLSVHDQPEITVQKGSLGK